MVIVERKTMMTPKRITNADVYRELGELQTLVKGLRHDLEDMEELTPRVKSLELFNSYVKGGFAVVSILTVSLFTFVKGVFGHF